MANSKIRSGLKSWRRGLFADMARSVGAASSLLARRAEGNAPVESGELRGSIEATPVKATGSRISSTVVVSSDHALSVEYGNRHSPAHPFFRPAVDASTPAMIATVERAAQ